MIKETVAAAPATYAIVKRPDSEDVQLFAVIAWQISDITPRPIGYLLGSLTKDRETPFASLVSGDLWYVPEPGKGAPYEQQLKFSDAKMNILHCAAGQPFSKILEEISFWVKRK